MKKAVILHGTDGKPTDQWLPWLQEKLQEVGYEVWAPLLPNNHKPDRQTYDRFLRESGWDFTDNLMIGHSSGATTVLNLLSEEWMPRISAAVLAGTFLNEKLTKSASWYEEGQFDDLFLDKYDAQKMHQKAGAFYFVHGSDDPFCDIEDARALCNELNGQFITIENGGHLGSSSGITELPQLLQALQQDGLLA